MRRHPLLALLSAQVALEVVLVLLVWLASGGRTLLVLAPMAAMFTAALVVGHTLVEPEPTVIRSLALRSGLIHAAVGAAAELGIVLAWSPWGNSVRSVVAVVFTAALLGIMAGVLTQTGLSVAAVSKHL